MPSTRARAALARIDAGWRDAYAAMLLESIGFMPDSSVQQDVIALVARKSGKATSDYQELFCMGLVDRADATPAVRRIQGAHL